MLYIIAKSVTLYSVYGEQLSDDCIAAGGWPFRVSYRMAKKRLNFAVITFRKFSLWYRDRLAKSSASPNQSRIKQSSIGELHKLQSHN